VLDDAQTERFRAQLMAMREELAASADAAGDLARLIGDGAR